MFFRNTHKTSQLQRILPKFRIAADTENLFCSLPDQNFCINTIGSAILSQHFPDQKPLQGHTGFFRLFDRTPVSE